MKLSELSDSKLYFEISSHVLHQHRFEFVKTFFGLIAALPIALSYKLWRTLLRGAGVLASGACLAMTLGMSKGLRELFISRVSSLAANLADWLLFPFALAVCFSRLLLASLIHPALFIRN